jgi:uncharacterized protein
VLAFSEALHTDLLGTGVSCTAVCPGPTKTEFVAVAEMQGLESNAPGFLWQSADAVAREGIEGMVHGRRTVIPGATNKVTAQAGRLTPRSVLLPVMRAIYGRS